MAHSHIPCYQIFKVILPFSCELWSCVMCIHYDCFTHWSPFLQSCPTPGIYASSFQSEYIWCVYICEAEYKRARTDPWPQAKEHWWVISTQLKANLLLSSFGIVAGAVQSRKWMHQGGCLARYAKLPSLPVWILLVRMKFSRTCVLRWGLRTWNG